MSDHRCLYVGMDGGGTKLKLKIADEHGKVIARAVGGPAQICHSVDQAWQSVFSTLKIALDPLGIHKDDPHLKLHVCMGLAGYEVATAKTDFLSRPHPFQQLLLYSDAYVACVGAHSNKTGGIIIIGTGVNGMAIVDEKVIQVGGWGFPHDDLGGGAWLGLQAIRLCMQSIDGRHPPSALSERVYHFFDSDNVQMTQWATHTSATELATLAPIVIEMAQDNEPEAITLLKNAGRHVSCLAQTLIKKSKPSLPLALFGGIASFVQSYLDDDIQNAIVERQADAEDGALLLIQSASYRE